MEKLLSLLFDYQRFEGDELLQKCIEATQERRVFQGVPLSDDMLELNAAGDPVVRRKREESEFPQKPND